MSKSIIAKFSFVFSVLLFSIFKISAQGTIENHPFDEVIIEVVKHLENDNLHGAYLEMTKIHPNDSNFVYSLNDRSYYLLNDTIEGDERFDEVLRLTQLGIDDYDVQEKYTFYFNKASAYFNKEDYSAAVDVYKEALVRFPYHYNLYYSLGKVYEELENYDEAVKMYKKSINLHPLNAEAHLALGALCYKAEKITEALMCFDMYLLLNPDGTSSFSILNAANNIVTTDLSEHEDKIELQISNDDDTFEDIDDLINNHVALRDSYKMKNKLKIAVVQQSHLMLGQLNTYEGNDGFFSKRYVPFFKWINKTNNFDNFAYTICYSIQNAKYAKLVEKKTKNVKEFVGISFEKIVEIFKEQEIIEDGEKRLVNFIYTIDGLLSFGTVNGEMKTGTWKYLDNEYFYKKSEGKHDSAGEYDGFWTTFYENGTVKSTMTYLSGKLNGEFLEYNQHGILTQEYNYINDNLAGVYKIYNKTNGALINQRTLREGKIENEYREFHELGKEYPKRVVIFEDGKFNAITSYFVSGKEESSATFIASEITGEEVKHYVNGLVESEIMYKEGKIDGNHKEYFANGNVFVEGQSAEGERSGTWRLYHPNGKLKDEQSYLNGKLHGEKLTYDSDGVLYYKYLFKKGDLYAYTFYNKKGDVLFTDDKSRGKLDYHGCYPNGNLELEGTYSLDGGQVGDWKFYSKNGVLESTVSYKEGKKDGVFNSFHENGNVKVEMTFEDGERINSYSKKNSSGILLEEGWYKDGEPHGVWKNYYEDGELKNELYFHKGEKHGVQKYYMLDGKLDRIDSYFMNNLRTRSFYNIEGEEFEAVNWPQEKEASIEYHYLSDNKLRTKINLSYGIYHGKFTSFHTNGQLSAEGEYLNGYKHGTWLYFYDNGQKSGETFYIEGNIDGNKVSYHKNGKVQNENFYVLGKSHGIEKDYNDKGILTGSSSYEYGKLSGPRKFYSEKGELQLIRYYFDDTLIGYSYLGTDGKEVLMIPLKNETGKIVSYFENGKVAREMEFVNGRFVGSYKTYHSNGQLNDDISYKNGEYEGAYLIYSENGTLIEKRNYHHGYYSGMNVKYHSNGKKKIETEYQVGEKNGTETEFDTNGKQIKQVVYFNDELAK